jgi:hypothetical protein
MTFSLTMLIPRRPARRGRRWPSPRLRPSATRPARPATGGHRRFGMIIPHLILFGMFVTRANKRSSGGQDLRPGVESGEERMGGSRLRATLSALDVLALAADTAGFADKRPEASTRGLPLGRGDSRRRVPCANHLIDRHFKDSSRKPARRFRALRLARAMSPMEEGIA